MTTCANLSDTVADRRAHLDCTLQLDGQHYSSEKNYARSNVSQLQDKSVKFQFRREMIPVHLGLFEVGSQFSLRWFFQHALAWKGHVRRLFRAAGSDRREGDFPLQ